MEINPNSQQPTGSSLPTSALGNIQRPGEYLRQIRVSQKRIRASIFRFKYAAENAQCVRARRL